MSCNIEAGKNKTEAVNSKICFCPAGFEKKDEKRQGPTEAAPDNKGKHLLFHGLVIEHLLFTQKIPGLIPGIILHVGRETLSAQNQSATV